MDSWNATCMISHLPIFLGDDAYAFLIAKMPHEGNWYASSQWIPITMFSGIYNGYGSLKNIEHEDSHRLFLQKLGFDDVGKSLNLYDLEAETMTVDGTEVPVSLVMMKKDIVNEMLWSFTSCCPETERMIRSYYEKFLDCRKKLLAFDGNKELPNMKSEYDILYYNMESSFLIFYGMYGFSGEVSCKTREMCIDHVELAGDLFTMNMLTTMLDVMRMAWHCPSGSGSQISDTTLNHILCDMIISNIRVAGTDQSYR